MRDGREALSTLGVALAAVAIQLPIYDRHLALLDEGYLLALAEEIARGKLLYRDVYVDNPFPGAFYLVSAWLRVAGTSIWASRLLAVGAFAVFTTLLFRAARAVMPRAWALGFAGLLLCYRIWAFPHWQIVSYSSLSATFLAGAVVLVLGAHALGAGACVGAAILCKQDYGLGVGAALGLAILLAPERTGKVRRALAFAGSAALVVAPALLSFAAHGALRPFFDQTVVRPLRAAATSRYLGLPPLLPLLHQDAALRAGIGSYFPAVLLTLAERWSAIHSGWLYRETAVWDVVLKLLFYAPFLVWAAAALRWARGGLRDRHLVLLAYAGGFLLAFNRPRDWVHLMMVYPPVLLVGTTLLAAAPARAARVLPSAALGLLALLSAELGRELRHAFDWPLASPRAGVLADAHNGPLLDELLAYIDAHAPPGAPVPVYPLQPMLEFLAGREGAGGVHVIWPGQDPARHERIIADLEARDVRLVIYSFSHYASLGSFRENAPRLFEYLARHYAIERVFAHEPFGPLWCALGRRPQGPPPGTALPGSDGLVPALWSFTPVLAERVGTPDAPVVARLPLDVPPEQPRLDFAYGIDPERWLEAPSGPFTFTVTVDGALVFRASVDPQRRLEDRAWRPASIDLAAHAGQRVTLAFAIAAASAPPRPDDLAGWAEPRLSASAGTPPPTAAPAPSP